MSGFSISEEMALAVQDLSPVEYLDAYSEATEDIDRMIDRSRDKKAIFNAKQGEALHSAVARRLRLGRDFLANIEEYRRGHFDFSDEDLDDLQDHLIVNQELDRMFLTDLSKGLGLKLPKHGL